MLAFAWYDFAKRFCLGSWFLHPLDAPIFMMSFWLPLFFVAVLVLPSLCSALSARRGPPCTVKQFSPIIPPSQVGHPLAERHFYIENATVIIALYWILNNNNASLQFSIYGRTVDGMEQQMFMEPTVPQSEGTIGSIHLGTSSSMSFYSSIRVVVSNLHFDTSASFQSRFLFATRRHCVVTAGLRWPQTKPLALPTNCDYDFDLFLHTQRLLEAQVECEPVQSRFDIILLDAFGTTKHEFQDQQCLGPGEYNTFQFPEKLDSSAQGASILWVRNRVSFKVSLLSVRATMAVVTTPLDDDVQYQQFTQAIAPGSGYWIGVPIKAKNVLWCFTNTNRTVLHVEQALRKHGDPGKHHGPRHFRMLGKYDLVPASHAKGMCTLPKDAPPHSLGLNVTNDSSGTVEVRGQVIFTNLASFPLAIPKQTFSIGPWDRGRFELFPYLTEMYIFLNSSMPITVTVFSRKRQSGDTADPLLWERANVRGLTGEHLVFQKDYGMDSYILLSRTDGGSPESRANVLLWLKVSVSLNDNAVAIAAVIVSSICLPFIVFVLMTDFCVTYRECCCTKKDTRGRKRLRMSLNVHSGENRITDD